MFDYKQRPFDIKQAELNRRWDKAFGKTKDKETESEKEVEETLDEIIEELESKSNISYNE